MFFALVAVISLIAFAWSAVAFLVYHIKYRRLFREKRKEVYAVLDELKREYASVLPPGFEDQAQAVLSRTLGDIKKMEQIWTIARANLAFFDLAGVGLADDKREEYEKNRVRLTKVVEAIRQVAALNEKRRRAKSSVTYMIAALSPTLTILGGDRAMIPMLFSIFKSIAPMRSSTICLRRLSSMTFGLA